MNYNTICFICNESDDGSNNIGYHYGNITCIACKKFFIRSEANNQFIDYKCNKNSNCSITTETRTLCQLCRYKKCKLFGLNIKSRLKQPSQSIRLENCLICNSESSGIHFGVLSCEGCKGFFIRSYKDLKYEEYKCKLNECVSKIKSCRYCRFQKCKSLGMSLDASKLGRPSNLVRYLRNESWVLTSSQQTNSIILPKAKRLKQY